MDFKEAFTRLRIIRGYNILGKLHALREQITCADGYTVSVQASPSHYCEPREDHGPYTAFELGFPSAHDDLLTPYIEDPSEEQTGSVFGYVPLDVVEALIAKHGGLKNA